MKSFINLKNKFIVIKNINEETSLDIEKQKEKNEVILKKNNFDVSIYYNQDILRDFSTEWELMESPEESGYTFYRYKIWKKEWAKFDIRMLPFLDTKVLYRQNEGNINDTMIQAPKISKIYDIIDIPNETYLKNVKLTVSLSFLTQTPPTFYEARLYLSFINPNYSI